MLQDKLNTKDQLRRRHMTLESHTCILQRNETVCHLFLRCNLQRLVSPQLGQYTPSKLSTEGSQPNYKTVEDARCNGNHYLNVLEYLEI
jgi:hypothetical protein